MAKIYLVTAEHYEVPGIISKAFSTEEGARRKCVELVNIMLDDMAMPQADAANWEGCLAVLQDIHGAANCYVEYAALPVDAD